MKSIILILVSIIAISCNRNDDENNVTPFVPIMVNSTLIGKQILSGPEDISQQNTVINNETDWNNLKNRIDSYYQPFGINYCEEYFNETTIDFENFTVIAIFDQIYGNGGHTIDITNIIEYENNIIVTVENLRTGNGSSVITQPYHIVKIPKATKPIVFE